MIISAPSALVPDPAVDAALMSIALGLGRRGLGRTAPNPAVGALVVRGSEQGPVIVGRGWTQPGGRPHAETEALARAGGAAHGATLFVTLEPCCHRGKTPPCTQAIIAAQISAVVSAIEDPNPKIAGQGHAQLRVAGIAVRTGIEALAATRAHAGHIRRIADGRPHVTLKLALSVDGKVGLLPRRPVPITQLRARDRVHLMRAMNDAILIGIGTALADDPALTCRLPGMTARSPVRVVLDSKLRLPLACELVRTARDVPVWVVTSSGAARDREQALRGYGVEILRTESPTQVDLAAALRWLGARGITRLMVEAGPRVAAAMITADLVDEIALFRSPIVIGSGGLDALSDLPLEALTRPRGLHSLGVEPIGPDNLETFVRV
jgi:diaminohydroxyphosphoribosylaminopyrimidine deaminase / 5-amino-6-(5-phosphoribosylamino)uracil reductase